MGSDKKCLLAGCVRPQYMRGLCMTCYGKAKKKVEAKETTWEKLVKVGMCVSDDPFDTAYEQAMKGV